MTPLEPLLRELVGEALRRRRRAQRRTLADVAARAGMSMQHLSDVERGRKDPSSEMVAAICGALDLTLGQLMTLVGEAGSRTDADGAAAPIALDLTGSVRARERAVGPLRTARTATTADVGPTRRTVMLSAA